MEAKYRTKRNDGKHRQVHTLIVEETIGRKLPKGAEVHHIDGNGFNNARSNLVICPSRAYHMLLHMRQKALEACGNANWLKCRFCKEYDNPMNLTKRKVVTGRTLPMTHHQRCENEYAVARRLGN
jgi:hypothetical protein